MSGDYQNVEYIGDGLGLVGRAADQMLLHGCSMEDAVRMLRDKMLIRALEACAGNITAASRKLGQHRNTMARELERLNLTELPKQIRRRHRVLEPGQEQAELVFVKPGISLVPRPFST